MSSSIEACFSNSENIHKFSYRNFELSKRYSFFAGAIVIVSASLSYLLGPASVVAPVISILLVILAYVIQRISKCLRVSGDAAKRSVLSSIVDDQDLKNAEAIAIEDKNGPLLQLLAHQNLAKCLLVKDPKPLIEYYDIGFPDGNSKKRMHYSQMAYWTSDMLRWSAFFYFFIAVAVLIFLFCYLYATAIGNVSGSDAANKLKTIFSIVIGGVLLKVVDVAIDALFAHWRIKEVSRSLIQKRSLDAVEVDRLCSEYDISTSVGPPVPTIVYHLRKNKLDKDWKNTWSEIKSSI